MAEPITMQKLTDASFDADTLGEFANEDKQVTSRLGLKYPSAPMASRLVVENGLLGATPFNTYAAMASNDFMVNGEYAVVVDDDTPRRNGVYERSLGGYKYLKYNILPQARAYTDERVAENNPNIKSIPLTTGTNTLPSDRYNNKILYLIGTVTADTQLVLPDKRAEYIIQSLVQGGHEVSVRSASDSANNTITISLGEIVHVFNTGTNLREVNNKKASIRSPIFQGTPTAPTADLGERTQQIANTNYVWGVSRAADIIELSDADSTLSAKNAYQKTLVFTGTLTKDIVITIPISNGDWNIRNATNGGFTISLRGSIQTGLFVDVPNNSNISCFMVSSILRPINLTMSSDNTKDVQKLKAKSFDLTAKLSSDIPVELSLDGMRVFNSNTRYLKYSDDYGKTWTTYRDAGSLINVDWIKMLDNGEILYHAIHTGTTPWTKSLWLSDGAQDSIANATWTKVVEYQIEGVGLSGSWGFFNYKNIVLVNEYGAKVDYPTSGMPDGADTGKNARYTRMSLDYGKTWTTIFDLNEHTTTDGVHLHGVAYDAWWQRIWVTYGDSSNGTMYSDDLGETWQIADYYGTSNSNTQMVHIKPMEDCLLFGSDTSPNGVFRISRNQGKHKGRYNFEMAYQLNDVTSLNYLCHSIFQARHNENTPVLIGFGAETASVPSVVLATYDGYTFTQIYKDAINQPVGRGVRSVIGVTPKNEVIVASNDERVVGKWSQINIKV